MRALSNAYSSGLLDSRAVLTIVTMPLLAVAPHAAGAGSAAPR
jgi:hypothetical protein